MGVRVEGGGCRDDPVFEQQVCTQLTHRPLETISQTASKLQMNKVPTSCWPTARPVSYLGAWAGVDVGIGRAYGVRDF